MREFQYASFSSLFIVVLINCGASTTVEKCDTRGARIGLSKFATSLYKTAVKSGVGENGNFMISPSGAAAVLGMLLAGTEGNTTTQLKRALFISTLKNPSCAIGQLTKSDKTNTLKSISQMFVAPQFSMKSEFLSVLESNFGTNTAEKMDFKSNKSRTKINQRVAALTNNRIKNLIPLGALDADSRMALVNSVFFKGTWRHQFHPKLTKSRLFYSSSSNRPLSSNKVISTKMMRSFDKFKGADLIELDARALELPYSGKTQMKMIIILPNHILGGLKKLESILLKKNNLMGILERGFKFNKITCHQIIIPKFTMETSIDLKDSLKKLGVKDLFDPASANLSGIDGSSSLYVSQALQRSFVEVNEEGTEAASGTVAVIQSRSLRRCQAFIANRPFIFLIHDDRMVHFMGRFVSPKP